MKKLTFLFLCVATMNLHPVVSQEFSQFDFGRMWTFENAPLDYLNETYDLELTQEWMDNVRQAALRFSTFCSASFISDQGLIMTNHHCSRGLIADLEKEGEDLINNGFYAPSLEEERKSEGLFVDQLIRARDITDEMKALQASLSSEQAQDSITKKYEKMEDWKDLRLQLVTYYSGGRYAIYGYKRYTDIRLVLLPENDLGYFGGDPDNFTFPRYNLDFTFWRAYDEEGKPLNTTDFYYPINPNGIEEGTPVFVVGNPGRTERYRTMTQLRYDRDVRIPAVLAFIKSGIKALEYQMETNPNPQAENAIFSLKNGEKAYTGILDGLHNAEYMDRKQQAENTIRQGTESTFAENENPWRQIDRIYEGIRPYGAYSTLLNASPYRGAVTSFLHKIHNYLKLEEGEDGSSLAEEIKSLASQATADDQVIYLQALIDDYEKFKGTTLPQNDAGYILTNSLFRDADKVLAWLESPMADPLSNIAQRLIHDYDESVRLNQEYGQEIAKYNEQIALAAFQVFGNQLPPDATFTLRFSDGVVKSVEYNGTVSPTFTTYYGLYDRYLSHNRQFPWSLPQAWLNPSPELLGSPLNFISTNDIIGGNSGSAVINAKGEAV
ncbi:MAG TPA: S46 family peptidase, partial [Membranihabitans sp.]|nr:S46 family peptidase [Membranihabitans sp.]